MRFLFLYILLIFGFWSLAFSQSYFTKNQPVLFGDALHVGSLTANDGSALVEMTSTTKGMLIPRMDQTARDAIGTPATGLMIYNTDDDEFNFYNSSAWTGIGGGAATDLSNLTSPTAINQTLIPDTNVTYDLGAAAGGNWNQLFVAAVTNATAGTTLSMKTVNSALDANTGGLNIFTGDQIRTSASTRDSGSLIIYSGDVTDANNSGDSGDVTLETGTVAGAGARGNIYFNEETLPAASVGHVWELQNVSTGEGAWSAPSGGVTGTGTDDRMMRWDGTTAAQDSVISVADTTGNLTNETAGQAWTLKTSNTTGATNSGTISVEAGNCVDGTCGDVELMPGQESGTGTDGSVNVVLGPGGALDFTSTTAMKFANTWAWDFTGAGADLIEPDPSDTVDLGDSNNTFDVLAIKTVDFYRTGNTNRTGEIKAGTLTVSGVGAFSGVYLHNPSADNQRDVTLGTATQTGSNAAGSINLLAGKNTSTGDAGKIRLEVGASDSGGADGEISFEGPEILFKNDRRDAAQAVNLTADDTAVTSTTSLLQLTSDNSTPANRTFTLAAGSDGQRLIIVFDDATNRAQLEDTGTALLSAVWEPDDNDSLSLIYSAALAGWVETSRSSN